MGFCAERLEYANHQKVKSVDAKGRIMSSMCVSLIMIKTTILDKRNGTSGPLPISVMPKWRICAPLRHHHCFRGKGDI